MVRKQVCAFLMVFNEKKENSLLLNEDYLSDAISLKWHGFRPI